MEKVKLLEAVRAPGGLSDDYLRRVYPWKRFDGLQGLVAPSSDPVGLQRFLLKAHPFEQKTQGSPRERPRDDPRLDFNEYALILITRMEVWRFWRLSIAADDGHSYGSLPSFSATTGSRSDSGRSTSATGGSR